MIFDFSQRENLKKIIVDYIIIKFLISNTIVSEPLLGAANLNIFCLRNSFDFSHRIKFFLRGTY